MTQSRVLSYGRPLSEAKSAMIMMHGRGASAEDILTIADEVNTPNADIAYIAPQAPGNVWYPVPYSQPIAKNEPHLSNSLDVITRLIAHINQVGIPTERIMLLGFSQGACLSLEYVARHPQRYGGVFALSGVLIENGDQPREYAGTLGDTPVFIGCSDIDPYFPVARIHRTIEKIKTLSTQVTDRIYPGMGHIVNDDELTFIRSQIV